MKTMMWHKHIQQTAVAFFALFCVCAFSACGKEGPPVTPKDNNALVWSNVEAMSVSASNITISALLSGNINGLHSIIVELEALDGEADHCPSCPFRATERFVYPAKLLTATDETSLEFIQTLSPNGLATQYRWRLIAKAERLGQPHSMSPVQLLILQ